MTSAKELFCWNPGGKLQETGDNGSKSANIDSSFYKLGWDRKEQEMTVVEALEKGHFKVRKA